MIRWLYILFLVLFSFKLMHIPSSTDQAIGRLPVLFDGRVMPLDSLARQQLLQIQGRLKLNGYSPVQWYFSHLTIPNFGNDLDTVLVEHPFLFDTLNPAFKKQKYRLNGDFLTQHIDLILPLIQAADSLEKEQRSPIQQAAFMVASRFSMQQLISTQFFPFFDQSQLAYWNKMLFLSQSFDPNNIESSPSFNEFIALYNSLLDVQSNLFFIFDDTWKTLPEAALSPSQTYKQLLSDYLLLADSFQTNSLNKLQQYSSSILSQFKSFSSYTYFKVNLEFIFNAINPFIVSLFLYFLIVLLVFFSRFFGLKNGHRFIKDTWVVALLFHTFGLVARIIILGRPPVINLYSSAIFIAYVVSIIGYIMYKKRGYLFFAGYPSVLALLSLIVAYHLSLSGNTMDVMQAVLNSNFWLSTHVVSMTIGYAIILMAGFFAISYILMGALTRILTPDFEDRLGKLVYVFLMIALFFNFLGTVLGGIWADQSWGRFWGWDPKENGAIMIVLWIAIILHLKWGRLLTNRWLMILTVFSNVVTAWSWKGTNMLGIGLHSYGFTEKTFYWLMIFFVSQISIMILGMLPLKYWLSFQNEENR
ncbi:MAG: cytochrome c biogenesis protein CcsA [Candidatus Margulisiibacteriota bacterium]|nr:cytochrome c biogenesis protein CcsA [Candidatus Margulisiibacteriota bacterium]